MKRYVVTLEVDGERCEFVNFMLRENISEVMEIEMKRDERVKKTTTITTSSVYHVPVEVVKDLIAEHLGFKGRAGLDFRFMDGVSNEVEVDAVEVDHVFSDEGG